MAESVHPCPHCGGAVAFTDKTCPHCGKGLTGKHLVVQPPVHAATRPAGMILCMLVAVLLVIAGFALTSQATQGVALLIAACFMAICGRLIQAGQHQKELLKTLGK